MCRLRQRSFCDEETAGGQCVVDLLGVVVNVGDKVQKVECDHHVLMRADGRVSVGDFVTDIFAQLVMPAVVIEMKRRAPQVRIDVLASNLLSDL